MENANINLKELVWDEKLRAEIETCMNDLKNGKMPAAALTGSF